MTSPKRPRGPERKTVKGTALHIESMVSGVNYRPYVTFELGKEKVQMETEQAMELVIHTIECVEGAISDAFLWRFFKENLQLEDGQVATVINEFREYRASKPVARGWYAG